jgi:hypothetical protein
VAALLWKGVALAAAVAMCAEALVIRWLDVSYVCSMYVVSGVGIGRYVTAVHSMCPAQLVLGSNASGVTDLRICSMHTTHILQHLHLDAACWR